MGCCTDEATTNYPTDSAFSVTSTDLIAPFSSLFWFTGPQLLLIVLFLAAAVKRLPC